MSTTDELCPEFENAPVVETVLGVQFEPLRGFRSNHYGWLWHQHLADKGFKAVSDENLLTTHVEEFGVPKLALTRPGMAEAIDGIRMKARTEDRARTVQLQPDKLYLSWNRRNPQAPRYASVKTELMAIFDDLCRFAADTSLGPVRPNLWDVHPVNQIPRTYSGEWHFEIQPERGRVRVRVAKMVMNQSTTPTLYLSLLGRGEVGSPRGCSDPSGGLDTGHAACIRLFVELTSPEAHAEWGLMP